MAERDTYRGAFNSGEWSPKMEGRVDLDPYFRALRTAKNVLIRPQGPGTKRGGTHFVKEVKVSANKTRLMKFEFSKTQSYILEFGNLYIRFYQLGGNVESSPGVPLEVVTPYLTAELFDLQIEQTEDIIYITHENHRPQKLSRVSALVWTIADFDNQFGPVLDRPPDQTITMKVKTGSPVVSGTTIIQASAAAFVADHVDSVWCFSEATDSLGAYAIWVTGTAFGAGIYVQNAGNLYFTSAGGTTGVTAPTHEFGTVSDGVVEWLFVNRGTGYARMSVFTSTTEASFVIQRHLPPTLVDGGAQFQATTFWNEAAWSDLRGWPKAMAIHEQRTVWGATTESPKTIWGSRNARRFEDFDRAAAEDDAAFVYDLDSADVNDINWLLSSTFLVAGTEGGLHMLRGSTSEEALTPTNVTAKLNVSYGANNVPAVQVNNTLKYIHRLGNKVYESKYSELDLAYIAGDVSLRAEHLIKNIVEMVVQEEPINIIWVLRGDGELIGITEDVDEQVRAFYREITGETTAGTFDAIESIDIIPGTNGDQLWMIVARNVGGATKRYVEFMELDEENTNKDFYVDSGITYDDVPATVLTGLTHLEGKDVVILADGAVVDPQVVSGGQVTLTESTTFAHVGLAFSADMSPTRLEAPTNKGPGQGKLKRVSNIVLRVLNTLGLKYGPDEDTLQRVDFRDIFDEMGLPPDTLGTDDTTDIELNFEGDWGFDGLVLIRSDDPTPMTIVAIGINVDVSAK